MVVAEEDARVAVRGCRIIPACQRAEAHVDEVAALVQGCGHIESGRAFGHPENDAQWAVEILTAKRGSSRNIRWIGTRRIRQETVQRIQRSGHGRHNRQVVKNPGFCYRHNHTGIGGEVDLEVERPVVPDNVVNQLGIRESRVKRTGCTTCHEGVDKGCQRGAVGPGDHPRGLRRRLILPRGRNGYRFLERQTGCSGAVVIGDGVVDDVGPDRVLHRNAAGGQTGLIVYDHVVDDVHRVPSTRVHLEIINVLPVDKGQPDTATVAGPGLVALDDVGIDHHRAGTSGETAARELGPADEDAAARNARSLVEGLVEKDLVVGDQTVTLTQVADAAAAAGGEVTADVIIGDFIGVGPGVQRYAAAGPPDTRTAVLADMVVVNF